MTDFSIIEPLASGFTVEITPLTPYYMDFVDMVYPFREFPKRTISLAAGDAYEIDFKPSENELYDVNHPDYELYIKYIATKQYNAKLEDLRKRAREDYLLSTCVKVVDGPFDENDEDWRNRMEAAFQERGWKIPTHVGELKLIFLKSAVIKLPQERAAIVEKAMYKEVSEQELIHAMSMFQSLVQ